ncbi:MAG: hypothetical protein MJZ31_09620 [Bacteroidales bacterium]|nr:hypothetical protein [Bacteroidales bacterium]
MTSLDREQHNQQMADMASFDEEMPSVGIFWYDEQEHSLFGVYKEQVTPKKIEEVATLGLPFINHPSIHHRVWNNNNNLKGDYTQIPRGRVSWNIDKFIVFVGKWADPIQDELTTLIEETFHLPYFEFVYDEHWDLGHGWSGDF